jgi:hypothetical protein
MIRTLRMSSLILYFTITMSSKLFRGNKRMRRREMKKKSLRKRWLKKNKDNKKFKIRYWQILEGKKKRRKPDKEWKNLDLTNTEPLIRIMSSIKIKTFSTINIWTMSINLTKICKWSLMKTMNHIMCLLNKKIVRCHHLVKIGMKEMLSIRIRKVNLTTWLTYTLVTTLNLQPIWASNMENNNLTKDLQS